jgi:phenylacetate-CoA ligase
VVAQDVLRRIDLEIVRPGTSEPRPDSEVGEVGITEADPAHPALRQALDGLSAGGPARLRVFRPARSPNADKRLADERPPD